MTLSDWVREHPLAFRAVLGAMGGLLAIKLPSALDWMIGWRRGGKQPLEADSVAISGERPAINFAIGDRVRHVSLGDGTVEGVAAKEPGLLTVRFDRAHRTYPTLEIYLSKI